MTPRRAATCVAAVLMVATLALGALRAGTWLVVEDPLPGHADAIVVLAGSVADRALEAADLYGAGAAPRIVLTRERERPEVAALARRGVVLPDSTDVTTQVLRGLGVPAEAIVTLETPADSTVTEAAVVARWACGHQIRTIVVVTSPTHTRRARAVYRRALGTAVAVAVRPARSASLALDRWWRDRTAAKALAIEWQKLLAYWLVDRWRLAPCASSGGLSRRSPS